MAGIGVNTVRCAVVLPAVERAASQPASLSLAEKAGGACSNNESELMESHAEVREW